MTVTRLHDRDWTECRARDCDKLREAIDMIQTAVNHVGCLTSEVSLEPARAAIADLSEHVDAMVKECGPSLRKAIWDLGETP